MPSSSHDHARNATPRARPSGRAAARVARPLEGPANRRDAVETGAGGGEGPRCRTCSRCATGAWSARRSRSTAGRRSTMAADLASTPVSGIRVQCCGDAHLCNFGGFATPERKVIFSINDLDETLPAPWEWDVKRLAASFVVACRDNGLKDARRPGTSPVTCVRSYRESMAEFSQLKTLELWYRSLPARRADRGPSGPISASGSSSASRRSRRRAAARRCSRSSWSTRGTSPSSRTSSPPSSTPRDIRPGEIQQAVRDALAGYRSTLSHAYQSLLDRYELRDAAIKVVGVGSVGTVCWVLLLTAGEGDPLFLQVKEARASVLGAVRRRERASRTTASASSTATGSCSPPATSSSGGAGGRKRDFFVRQLRDMKLSVRWRPSAGRRWTIYAGWCGRALALSHARSGTRRPCSAGTWARATLFDKAIAAFAVAYADQNEKDHAALDARGPQGQGEGGLRRGEVN